MTLPEELAFTRLSYGNKYHKAVPGYMKRIRDLYEAVYARFGEDGLDLIRDVSTEYGTRIANNARKKGDLKGIRRVGSYLLSIFDMITEDWEVTEYTKDRMVVTVSRCPYSFEREEICRAHTAMEKALIRTLDDTLEYRIGCSIPQGDRFCEHILCRRSASRHPGDGDPGPDAGQ
jgi:hypothetical protein